MDEKEPKAFEGVGNNPETMVWVNNALYAMGTIQKPELELSSPALTWSDSNLTLSRYVPDPPTLTQ